MLTDYADSSVATSGDARRASTLARRLGRQPRLLLAEDDDELRWALTEVFEELGFEVRSLMRGDQLLERIAFSLLVEDDGRSPDVIVTDVRLPSFNGLEVIEGMRRAGWKTPVLVVSAFGDAALRRRIASLGHAEFFAKPIDVDALVAAIERLVATYALVTPSRG